MCLHHLRPEQPRRAQLCHFHEVIHADGKEEGQARGKGIDIKARGNTGAHIFQTISKRVGKLQIRRGASFLHVIAGHRNEVEFRHVMGAIAKDIRNDPHRGRRRIDIGVAHHEFFQHIILDGASQCLGRHTLLASGTDEQSKHRQDRAIHRHRDTHPVQRNIAEQCVHIRNRINRHPGHANIISDQIIIRIIPAVRWQIEGHRQPHLPSGKIAPVESVGLLSRRETGILADCPGPRCIHGRIGAAQKWRRPWHGAGGHGDGVRVWRHDRWNGDLLGGYVIGGHVISG